MKKFIELTETQFNNITKVQCVKINSNTIKTKLNTLLEHHEVFLFYIWLTANIAREEWNDESTNFSLREQYYSKGFLVCTFSLKVLANMFKMDRTDILNNIKKMEKLGWIKIEQIKSNDNFKLQNVYILGEWKIVVVNGKKEYIEILYFNN